MPLIWTLLGRSSLSLPGWGKERSANEGSLSHCRIIDHVVENLAQLQGGIETGWKWMRDWGTESHPDCVSLMGDRELGQIRLLGAS